MAEKTKPQMKRKLFDQLMDIREAGEVNMFDRAGVQVAANDREYYELVVWLEDNRRDYGRVVFGEVDIIEEA